MPSPPPPLLLPPFSSSSFSSFSSSSSSFSSSSSSSSPAPPLPFPYREFLGGAGGRGRRKRKIALVSSLFARRKSLGRAASGFNFFFPFFHCGKEEEEKAIRERGEKLDFCGGKIGFYCPGRAKKNWVLRPETSVLFLTFRIDELE